MIEKLGGGLLGILVLLFVLVLHHLLWHWQSITRPKLYTPPHLFIICSEVRCLLEPFFFFFYFYFFLFFLFFFYFLFIYFVS